MRRFLVLVATWLALCGGVVVAQQVLPGFPPGAFSNKAALDPAPGGGSTTTFDPANLGTNLVLSGGNLTVANPSGVNSNRPIVRTIASHTTGKYYCEFTMGTIITSFVHGIGILNSSENLSSGGGLGFQDNNGGGAWDNGAFYFNNSSAGTAVAFGSGDVVSMAFDADNQLIWFRDNGGSWNGSGTANPATGIGGISTSVLTGAIYAGASVNGVNSTTITANFHGSAYSYTPPLLFGDW